MTSDNQPSDPRYVSGYSQENSPYQGPSQPGADFGRAHSSMPPPKKRRTGLAIGIIATAMILIIAAVVGFVIFNSNSDNDSPSSGNDKASSENNNDEEPADERLEADDNVYSFELPDGFTAGSLSVGKAPDYNIKVVLNGGKPGEQLSVSQEGTSAKNIDELEQRTKTLAQAGSDFTRTAVNGKDAISYKENETTLSDTGGSFEYRILAGNQKQIRVACIYLEPANEQNIKKGCDKVTETLKF